MSRRILAIPHRVALTRNAEMGSVHALAITKETHISVANQNACPIRTARLTRSVQEISASTRVQEHVHPQHCAAFTIMCQFVLVLKECLEMLSSNVIDMKVSFV